MYVPGLLKDTDTFICDIGTGYYVEKVILSEILIYHKIKTCMHVHEEDQLKYTYIHEMRISDH